MSDISASSSLIDLSNQLAAAVVRAASSLVAVHARPRLASSGVHWRDGLIVTTAATVRRDSDIGITLPDGRRVPATLVGGDAAADIAVLKLANDVQLPPATLGDAAALKPGHLVLALARLDDSGPRVSFGAVSAVGGAWRTWKGGEYSRRVQSGLTLYPGFGGGPLVDASGAVTGINSGGLSRHFATTIPLDAVDRVLAHLAQRGYVPRAWIGAAMQSVSLPAALRASLVPTRDHALLVMDVVDDGPAARGGLLVGDLVLAVDGKAVHQPQDVLRALDGESVGRPIAFDLVRGGAPAQVTVVVGDRPRTGPRQGG